MFIAIIGTRFSGKSSIENYLVATKGFKSVRLVQSNPESDFSVSEEKFEIIDSQTPLSSDSTFSLDSSSRTDANLTRNFFFISMGPIPSPGPIPQQTLCFSTPGELLEYVTDNWQNNYVTVDLYTRELVELFIRRPFFNLLCCDAPLMERFNRSKSFVNASLEDFIQEDDRIVFGSLLSPELSKANCLRNLNDLVNFHVNNSFPNLECLHRHLDALDLLHPEHLRPNWETYFMVRPTPSSMLELQKIHRSHSQLRQTLASLASCRSNCMKRRVGAVLVRDNRVLATGYNGTPRGLKNCNEGGCPHCNRSANSSAPGNGCVCLHAEENALLEAGRERIGKDCVLYCNTCPCLTCTVKIIQAGVTTVVYNLTYKVDSVSASLFEEAGVQLRRYDPNTRFRVSLPLQDEKVLPIKSGN